MSDAVIVGLIAAIASIIASVITSKATQNKVQEDLKASDKVQNVKIDHLTDEVNKLTSIGEKIPALEGDIKVIKEKISLANHRIDGLERKVG